MKRLLVILGVLWLTLFACPLFAQTHPCDQPQQLKTNANSPIRLGFCVPQADVSRVLTFKAYLDSATTPAIQGSPAPIGTPSATGMTYFELGPIPVTTGDHSITVTITDSFGKEWSKAVSLPFGVLAPLAAPVNLRVKGA